MGDISLDLNCKIQLSELLDHGQSLCDGCENPDAEYVRGISEVIAMALPLDGEITKFLIARVLTARSEN